MHISKLVAATAAAALTTTPAWALPSQASSPPGASDTPNTALAGGPSSPNGSQEPGDPSTGSGHSGASHKPTAPRGQGHSRGKAYGRMCQNEGKKHVPGQKGTPFSQCVLALAKLHSGRADSPQAACVNEGKKHVPGHKGTPFSQCVVAGAHANGNTTGAGDQQSSSSDDSTSPDNSNSPDDSNSSDASAGTTTSPTSSS